MLSTGAGRRGWELRPKTSVRRARNTAPDGPLLPGDGVRRILRVTTTRPNTNARAPQFLWATRPAGRAGALPSFYLRGECASPLNGQVVSPPPPSLGAAELRASAIKDSMIQ